MNFLFFFLDGVGLGVDDPAVNPLAAAQMPHLQNLLGGARLLAKAAPAETARATLLALDAGLGVAGLPQSATGQAALLTGKNVPALVGEHYGPKPNPPVAEVVRNGNLFNTLEKQGLRTTLLNAYPDGYFQGINSGKRLYSAIPLAATSAGLSLKTADDLYAGTAMSPDFTAAGWRKHLGYADAPLLEPSEAGQKMAALAQAHDFAFFEFWLSDYLGHRRDMPGAVALLEKLDAVLGGLLAAWDDTRGLIFITSDHGNMEDLGTRRHTPSRVPGLIIGAPALRTAFAQGLTDITGVAGAVRQFFGI